MPQISRFYGIVIKEGRRQIMPHKRAGGRLSAKGSQHPKLTGDNLTPGTQPREGWEGAFAQMAARGDDQLLDPETPTEWDKAEWEW